MQEALAEEIIACLPRGRTLFYYYPDRYAAYLLARHVGDGMPIAAVKRGRYGRLLARPHIAELIGKSGDGVLRAADLEALWPDDDVCYRLTLTIWAPDLHRMWHQTSRRGANLVLQLGFPAGEDARFRRFASLDRRRAIAQSVHPNSHGDCPVLAWARLDIDLDAGVALIEEIQTDWLRALRELEWAVDDATGDGDKDHRICAAFCGRPVDVRALYQYAVDLQALHRPIWDEAMLTAALWFLIEEIGVSEIYYHDAACGRMLKRIDYSAPPRSLYTSLPRRFCFEKTAAPPAFLAADEARRITALQKAGKLAFWHMAV